MPSCLKCGRDVEAGLELFCPRCLGKTEIDEGSRKKAISQRFQLPGVKYLYRGIIAIAMITILIFGAVFWRHTTPATSQLTIPDSFSSIQEGIAAAEAGDTIVLKPGVYHENIDFMGKAVTLRSINPRDPDVVASTVIQGNGKASTVLFQSGETGETVLQGLTLAGERKTHGNSMEIDSPGIVFYGGVIFIDGGSAPTIRDNVITSGTARRGGAVYINRSSPSIINNTISGNMAHWEGGAFYISEGSAPLLSENDITHNSAEDGGGIYVLDAAPLLKDNRIVENSALYQGGGIMIRGGTAQISGNTFKENKAEECGGAAAFFAASPLLRDNHFTANEGGWRGGGALYVGLQSNPQLEGNTFTQNKSTQGNDIWVSADSLLQQTETEADVYYQE